MASPHEILDVDPDAADAEIEEAYRQRVKETHPDQGGSVGEFLRVRRAYEQLTDGHAVGGDPAGAAGPAAARDSRGADPSPAADVAGAHDADDAAEKATQTTVEYLDFDVLVDHGWDLEDGDLFAKAASADLDPPDYGEFTVEPDETLLQAAERHGFEWPYSCRGGACANCAVAVLEGELSVPVNHILPEEMMERDVRLSCVGEPLTDELRVVFNVKHLPELDELRLPPHPWS